MSLTPILTSQTSRSTSKWDKDLLEFPARSEDNRQEQREALEDLEASLGWTLFLRRLEEEEVAAFQKVLEAEEPHLLTRLQGEARAWSRASSLLEDLREQLNVRE